MIHAHAASMQRHPTCGSRGQRHVLLGRLAVLVVGLLLLALSCQVHASCTPTTNYQVVNVSFPSVTITLPADLYPNLVFWTSPPVPVSGTTQGFCRGNTPNGLQNQYGGGAANSSDDTLFPIGNTGVSYRILYTGNNAFTKAPNGVRAYGDQPSATGNNLNLDGTAQLQLVMTNPAAFAKAKASSINGGALAQWDVSSCLGRRGICWFPATETPVIDFNLSGVTFGALACNNPSVTVILPTVFSSSFTGPGSTTGQRSFNVQLTCSAGANVSITLATSTQPIGLNASTGVIANAIGSGFANNIGVQVLNGPACTVPVTFGTTIPEGTTPNGTMNLPFCARYYQTGANVSGGKVNATATYTLTYQ